MEHPGIDEQRILDRYLAGRLGPEEEAGFEEHLFECEACLEQVEAGESLRRGLQSVAARQGASPQAEPTQADASGAAVIHGPWARLRELRPLAKASLAAAALLLLSLSTLVLRQRGELERLRASADPALTQPVAALAVVSLGLSRSDSEPVVIRLGPEQELLLLSLELPGPAQPGSAPGPFRVELEGAVGERLWRAEGLEPSLYDSLLVALPAGFLAPGEYRVRVLAPGEAPGAGTVMELTIATER